MQAQAPSQPNIVINLDATDYEAWLDFIFDHPELPYAGILQGMAGDPWYFEDSWQYTISGTVAVERLTALFRAPERLEERYREGQLDQGFWFIPGPQGMMWVILDESIPWSARQDCIRSIESLTAKLLCKVAGSAGRMWWDSLFSYCVCGKKDLGSDLAVLTEVTRCMVAIARLEDPVARSMSRHGLVQLGRLNLAKTSPELLALYAEGIALVGAEG